jgi:hypothetical protein
MLLSRGEESKSHILLAKSLAILPLPSGQVLCLAVFAVGARDFDATL